MKPVPISHNEYRGFLRKKLREYYPDFSSISKDTWHIYHEFKKGLKNKPCKWLCRRKIWEYSQSSQTGQR